MVLVSPPTLISHRCMGSFLDCQLHFFSLYLYFYAILYSFNFYRLVIIFEINKCEFSNSVAQDYFSYSGSLDFLMNFRISIAISAKKYCNEPISTLGSTTILTVLFSNLLIRISFNLFRCFLISFNNVL